MFSATAVIPSADFVSLVDSLGTVRVVIGEPERGRVVTLGQTTVGLVGGRGLRLRGNARINWDFALVSIPVTVNVWQLLLAPKVVLEAGSHVLSFDPRIEELDVNMVPGFVDEGIAKAIRGTLEKHRERLAWDFTRALTLRLSLPSMISPSKTFEMVPRGGDVSVSDSEVRLAVQFEARFRDRAPAETKEASERTAELHH